MFHNYRYFIVLAEECNINRASERLFITHQNLSHYLVTLEKEMGVTLFNRKPTLSLTYAGRVMLDAFRAVEMQENNLRSQLKDLREENVGELRLGTTEGRFRILMPNLISACKEKFPGVELKLCSANSAELRNMIANNQLDIMVAANAINISKYFESKVVLEETLYLVVSDKMLEDIFGHNYEEKKAELYQGADLRLFKSLPFAINLPQMNSTRMINELLNKLDISLNVIHSSSHPDLHHVMTCRNFAASFSLTMYLPGLFHLRDVNGKKLNVFPIKGLTETNPVSLVQARNRIFPAYVMEIRKVLKEQCAAYIEYDKHIKNMYDDDFTV